MRPLSASAVGLPPRHQVIVPDGSGGVCSVAIAELLPYEYRWDDALQSADVVKRGP